jgi:phage tail sheath protein FI
MATMKTPGVYIVEKSAFPSSVVEVATAVPAFIGYTEKADNAGKSLLNKPWRITSMADYHRFFGGAPMPIFEIAEKGNQEPGEAKPAEGTTEQPEKTGGAAKKAEGAPEKPTFTYDGKDFFLSQTSGKFYLYYSMMLFYQNGGGPCYIVSVGSYGDDIEQEKMAAGIELLVKEQEPTMVVIPDAMLLDPANCITLQQASLAHCGGKMKNRVSVLDVYNGFQDRQDPAGDCIADFRNKLGINYLDFAAAYYPWINCTIVQDSDLSYENLSKPDVLQKVLKAELKLPDTTDDQTPAKIVQQKEAVDNITKDWSTADSAEKKGAKMSPEEIAANKRVLNKSLVAMSPLFNNILGEVKNMLNLLPPSAAMAGVYTMVDNSQGVWKAPANVSLNSVVSPTVNITHDEQEDLNVTTQGKSINAIRSFIGEGVLVWGARTLDGNSLDWRYINVRRTMIMLEESIRLATKAYVFEDNVATTWVTIKSMIRNFLTGIWKRGGLAGASPDDAFSVHVGLGETMTPEDILEGILRVTVLVALVRPAEFIEITFQQQMQKS